MANFQPSISSTGAARPLDAAHPDARIFDLCRRWRVAEDEFLNSGDENGDLDDDMAAVAPGILAQVAAIRPVTLEGVAALAQLALDSGALNGGDGFDELAEAALRNAAEIHSMAEV